MKQLFLIFCLGALIAIHTTDMLVTQEYIGDCWEEENFPPMRWSIKNFGIDWAVWISRGIMYSLMLVYLLNQHKRIWQYLLILGTILYYTSMIQWLFYFNVLTWI